MTPRVRNLKASQEFQFRLEEFEDIQLVFQFSTPHSTPSDDPITDVSYVRFYCAIVQVIYIYIV